MAGRLSRKVRWGQVSGRWMAVTILAGIALLGAGCGGSTAPQGIMTLAPHLTETVFALGQGKRVVAVGKFDDYPLAVSLLPDVGGYLDPDLEAIGLLNPALLIVPGDHRKVSEYAALNTIPVLNVNMDSLATIDAGIATIGEALGAVKQADALRQQVKSEVEAMRAAVGDRPPVRVLIVTSRERGQLDNLFTVGKESFVSEMVELAGGQNIFGDQATGYFEASKETMVMAAPEAIIEFHAGKTMTSNQKQAFYDDWMAFTDVPAVKNGRIYLIQESHALRPGPRVVDIARIVARSLHADVEIPAVDES
ncbi:MAG: ABC transporter substrate-binding protein [Candidatus Hydrogenedentes bacterium]|nr:ABC transporter substrate-binding protein [Candidatus Hydrogenedentota bacterium]